MAPKRKRSQREDEDDEEPTLGKQVLPIANLPDDFDGTPQDGMQYLFTVRRAALQLPHTTRVHNPYEIKEDSDAAASDTLILSPSHPALPCEEWRDVFLRHFKNFRMNSTQPTTHIAAPPPGRKLIPDMRNRDAWWAFLTGRPATEWDAPKKPKGQRGFRAFPAPAHTYGRGMRAFADVSEYEVVALQYDEEAPRAGPGVEDAHTHMSDEREVEQAITINPAESLPTPSSTPAPDNPADRAPTASSSSTSGTQPEPTPSLLRGIDHRYALHLLMYFTYWIQQHLEQPAARVCPISETHARWMFVLLARVDDFITADEQSSLRTLARGCISLIRERMQQPPAEDPSDRIIGVPSCWMVVAAVTGMWGQRDLWMDAESMLSELSTS